ncbi:LOW QUALITY PROTEIN: cytoplasmic phosphatidylinositol transfer protein 1 [Lepidochelys kempii]|uniref:LOW QUALITY PROTEIN: cytoplasmic phosphatidylinositol transfer protein 1 n=1 Tax=Lepidochelys kempii TaxID=8472 RepID=UPI003C6F8846
MRPSDRSAPSSAIPPAPGSAPRRVPGPASNTHRKPAGAPTQAAARAAGSRQDPAGTGGDTPQPLQGPAWRGGEQKWKISYEDKKFFIYHPQHAVFWDVVGELRECRNNHSSPALLVCSRNMLLKEYRICMPLTVEEYRIGQLYMISKHSHEQSDRGEGVEVVQNEPYEDPNHGNGQLTEKRVYLNSKLPSWARAVVPKIFYITEKAWNYYPYTITEYTCSFLPKFSIHIETKYEDNKGSNDNIFDNEAKDLEREVCFIDIACDEIPERYYKESEDPKHFKSEKTGRGLLKEGWRETHQPIMCSYKLVTVKFEVWGLQTRVEQFVHKVVRDILMIGHRQAFAWVDEWYDMTMDEVREFERATQEATNEKIGTFPPAISISNISLPSSTRSAPSSAPSTPLSSDAPEFLSVPKDRPRKKSAPETLTLPDPEKKAL